MGLKKFLQTVSEPKRIGLDTMCFIYQYEEGPVDFCKLANKFFTLVEKEKKKAFTSIITLSEILSKEIIWQDPYLKKKALEAFKESPFLTIRQVDADVAEFAPHFRVNYNLKLPDAIQIATAILEDCDLFITNDDIFKRVKEIEILVLKDFV